MYPDQVREDFRRRRRQGRSVKELALEFKVSLSTASLWARSVEVTDQGVRRLKDLLARSHDTFVRNQYQQKKYAARREAAYLRGLASNPTPFEALCVGLYWGEGSKSTHTWEFSNSDREAVGAMVRWAVMSGQAPGQFRASVQIHPEDSVRDEEVVEYWSEAGIPKANIKVRRLRSKNSSGQAQGKTPYGTCRLNPIKNGVVLFSFLEGQRQKIARPGSQVGKASDCKSDIDSSTLSPVSK